MQSTEPRWFVLPCLDLSAQSSLQLRAWYLPDGSSPPQSQAFQQADFHKHRQSYPAVVLLCMTCGATSPTEQVERGLFANSDVALKLSAGWIQWMGSWVLGGPGHGMNKILWIKPGKAWLCHKRNCHLPLLAFWSYKKEQQLTCQAVLEISEYTVTSPSVQFVYDAQTRRRTKLLVTEQDNLSRPNRIKIHFFQ